jgi:hypothetical protein
MPVSIALTYDVEVLYGWLATQAMHIVGFGTFIAHQGDGGPGKHAGLGYKI